MKKVIECQILRFNEIDSNFDMILQDAIDPKSLKELKINGQILASKTSQSSFSEYWDNEDDNYWKMYIDENEEN